MEVGRTEPNAEEAISARRPTKRFGETIVPNGLDLRVRTGEAHGFLGPNGAGKSTTLRVVPGLLRADGGDRRLLAGDPWRDAALLHRCLAHVWGGIA